jgi:hypothetical protein
VQTPVLPFGDGALHWVACQFNSLNDWVRMKGDLFSEIADDTAFLGSPASGTGTRIVISGRTGLTTGGQKNMQVAQFFTTRGGGFLEEIYCYDVADDVNMPGVAPGDLIFARTGSLAVRISPENVSYFSEDVLTPVYDAAFSHSSSLGVLFNNSHENLLLYSNASTGATNVSITPTDTNGTSPDGYNHATTLLSTNFGAYQARLATTVAGTVYTGKVDIREVTPGQTGKVIIYDESNAAELNSTVFTATSSSQEVQVIATTVSGGVSTSLRVELDGIGGSVDVWGWHLEEGTGIVSTVRTEGSTQSSSQSLCRLPDSISAYKPHGEIQMTFVLKKEVPSGELHYLFSSYEDDANILNDQRILYVDSSNNLYFVVRDLAGAEVSTLLLGTVTRDTEHSITCRWHKEAFLSTGTSVSGQLDSNAVVSDGIAFSTDGSDFNVRSFIGSHASTVDTAFDGLISEVKVYNRSLDT